jgi:hypothetical protein
VKLAYRAPVQRLVGRRATTNHSVVQRKTNLSNSRKDTRLIVLFRGSIPSPHQVDCADDDDEHQRAYSDK